MQVTAIPERLAQVTTLDKGDHDAKTPGEWCVMEAAAYVAGEPWSDHPQCACPVITAFMISWNDSLPDEDRTRLLAPLIPAIVGTRSTPAVESRRSFMALDWLIRVHTPKWLALNPKLQDHAEALRGLDEIADLAGAVAVGVKVNAARAAARAAAGDAARAAAGDAAWAAAGDAAWDAAGAAAGDAAWAAAWAAAQDAAWAAQEKQLRKMLLA